MNTTSKTFSVAFIAKRPKIRQGKLPIYMRITVEGERKELSLKQWIDTGLWNDVKGAAKGNSPEAKQLNFYLERVRGKVAGDYKELLINGAVITAEKLRGKFIGIEENTKTLLELIDYHNENMQRVLKPGTLKNYYTTRRYVSKFIKEHKRSAPIYLSDLSYQFLVEFENYARLHPLKDYDPLDNNGLMKHIERLKKITNLGLKMGWLNKNPFTMYKLKFEKFDRSFLTQQELDELETKEFDNEHLQTVKDLFIFSCYTGLAPIDLCKLTPDKIVTGQDGKLWVHTYREKTKTAVRVPLLPVPLQLIGKYRNHPLVVSRGKVFPTMTNQEMNRCLKIIAEVCGIKKSITFYLARHTFATTITLSNGVPIETVSKMLGHTKLPTTQIYARVLSSKIGNDMDALTEKLEKRKSEKTVIS